MKKEKKDNENYMAMGMCLGICIGTSIGVAFDNIPIFMSMGMCIGMCLGLAIGESKKEKNKSNKK